MNDRFRFRTPIYGADGKFKKFVYWPAVYGAPAVTCREGDVLGQPEQCTGLKDKNGRLIYEGDIVKAEVKEPELKVIGIITFGRYVHDLGFYVEWKGAPAESRKYYPGWRQDLFYWLEEERLEVIGNIHENPELLEGVRTGVI